MVIFYLIIIPLWLYILSVLKRGKLEFYRFLIGILGMFFIFVSFIPIIQKPVIGFFTDTMGILCNLTGFFESYGEYGMFFINHKDTVISLYLDLECSGLIEIAVFTSLITFFNAYNNKEKFFICIGGNILIILFNFIRIFVIIMLIYLYGSNIYAFAHAIVGRIIFYVLTISLYFKVFTSRQIKKQKVGNFEFKAAKENNSIE